MLNSNKRIICCAVLAFFAFMVLWLSSTMTYNRQGVGGTVPTPVIEVHHAPYYAEWCGSPVGTIYHMTASLDSVGLGVIALMDDAGEVYVWECDTSTPYANDRLYLLMMDDMGTVDFYDDIIVKLYQEIY